MNKSKKTIIAALLAAVIMVFLPSPVRAYEPDSVIDGRLVSRDGEWLLPVATIDLISDEENGHIKGEEGWDLYAYLGTPVYAVGDGKVIEANCNDGYCRVVIEHETEITLYGHLKEVLVLLGDRVSSNTQIGEVGVSGIAPDIAVPHTHFGIYKLGMYLNPAGIIFPSEYFNKEKMKFRQDVLDWKNNHIAGSAIPVFKMTTGSGEIDMNQVESSGSPLLSQTQQEVTVHWLWPVDPQVCTSINVGFGEANAAGSQPHHTGIDRSCDTGTPVQAVAEGLVVFTGWWPVEYEASGQGHGNIVAVQHGIADGKPLITIYAHLDTIKVQKGQAVEVGQDIGTVGQTGAATGPHLHFAVLNSDWSDNSIAWLDGADNPWKDPYDYIDEEVSYRSTGTSGGTSRSGQEAGGGRLRISIGFWLAGISLFVLLVLAPSAWFIESLRGQKREALRLVQQANWKTGGTVPELAKAAQTLQDQPKNYKGWFLTEGLVIAALGLISKLVTKTHAAELAQAASWLGILGDKVAWVLGLFDGKYQVLFVLAGVDLGFVLLFHVGEAVKNAIWAEERGDEPPAWFNFARTYAVLWLVVAVLSFLATWTNILPIMPVMAEVGVINSEEPVEVAEGTVVPAPVTVNQSAWEKIAQAASKQPPCDPALIYALWSTETGVVDCSGYRDSSGANACRSPVGAEGPLQFMPTTWPTYAETGWDVWDLGDATQAACKMVRAIGLPNQTTEQGFVNRFTGLDNIPGAAIKPIWNADSPQAHDVWGIWQSLK